METVPEGGVLTPAGFRASAASAGIKTTPGALDVAVLACDEPASAAGVFTTSRFAAAAVGWCRRILPSGRMRAIVVNSGNANSCTGRQGDEDAAATAALAAELIGCHSEQVAVASTGIIGHPLPMDKVAAGVRAACGSLSRSPEAARAAERAIMTTDTRPKAAAVRSRAAGRDFCVGGMAKGAGMIAPHMATMLAFATTDAAIDPDVLQQVVARVADRTFNRITIDGDSSTNDSLIVLAGGSSGVRVPAAGPDAQAFEEALHAVLASLSEQIVRDGEGATKLVTVAVKGALTEDDAERAARAVAESLLFKCAVHGGDPNWGRIVCALGYSGAQVEPACTSVHIGDVCVLTGGTPTRSDAAAQMKGGEVAITVDLGLGSAEATVKTCDLSYEYVRINADYHT